MGDWPMFAFVFVFAVHCGGLKQSWIRSCLKGSRVADIVISTFLHACVQEVGHFEAKLKNKNRTKVVVCGTWDSFRVYLMKWSWRIWWCYGEKDGEERDSYESCVNNEELCFCFLELRYRMSSRCVCVYVLHWHSHLSGVLGCIRREVLILYNYLRLSLNVFTHQASAVCLLSLFSATGIFFHFAVPFSERSGPYTCLDGL